MGDPEKTLKSDLRLKDDIAIQNRTKRKAFQEIVHLTDRYERDGHTQVLFKTNTVACSRDEGRSLAPAIL